MTITKLIPASFALSKLVRLGAVLLLMGSVSVEDFSIWISCSLVLQYTGFLQLGIPAATSRELAIAIGQNDLWRAVMLQVTAIKVQIMLAALIVVIVVFIFGRMNLALLIIGYIVTTHFSALMVTAARFSLRNKVTVFSQLADALVILTGLFYASLTLTVEGLLAIYLAANMTSAFICLPSKRVLRKSFSLDREWLSFIGPAILQALPLVLFSFLILFRGTWDIILIELCGDASNAGFSGTLILTDSFRTLTALLMTVFVPVIANQFGKANATVSSAMIRHLNRFAHITIALSITCVLITFFFGDTIMREYLPQYQDLSAEFFLKVIVLSTALISMPYYSFLTATRQVKTALSIISASLISGIFIALVLASFFDILYALLVGSFAANCLALAAQFIHIKYYLENYDVN
jgi:hypothetical protein